MCRIQIILNARFCNLKGHYHGHLKFFGKMQAAIHLLIHELYFRTEYYYTTQITAC